MKKKNKIIVFVLAVFVSVSALYWFFWRPSELKRTCALTAELSRNLMIDFDSYNDVYNDCLKNRGF